MRPHRLLPSILLLLTALCLGAMQSRVLAQCSTCSFTAVTGGNYNLTGNQTICVTGNVGDFNMNTSGTGNKICVAPGATWSISSGLNFNASLTIDVYGTLNANGNYNVNGSALPIFNIHTGATMNTNTGGFGAGLTINNDGALTFTNTSISNAGSFSLINTTTGVVSATATDATLTFGQGSYVQNSGQMTFSNLENSESDIRNLTGGIITIGRRFFNHGNLINDSQINTICGAFGTVSCEFIVGDKGAGKTFTITSIGCMKVNGTVTFNGPGFVNGILEVTGDFTVNKAVSGTGRVIVDNGVSTIAVSGGYTVAAFCDKNTAGHTFDVVNANSPATTVVYTVDCSANTWTSGAACSLTAVATPGLCATATNTYSTTAVVQLTNPGTGTLTVSNGAQSLTFATTTAGSATYTAIFNGLISDGASHTVMASLPGCGIVEIPYMAPASCSCPPARCLPLIIDKIE